MASPSSSRAAEARHLLKRGLLVAAGLGQIAALLAAIPAVAQEPAPEPPVPEVGPDPAPEPASEPAPVPSSLDELIPADALEDPEAWAARGGGTSAAADEGAGVAIGVDGNVQRPPPAFLQPALDAAFADFAVEVPEPLAPDPELEALASLAGPALDELPELEDVTIGDALVLGLPLAPGAFPERRAFIARFRELSNLRQLDGDTDAAPQIAARARADEELLGEMLRTYGYYSGEVVRQLSGGRRARENGEEAVADIASEPRVRFDLLPGARYRFGRIDLGGLSRMTGADAERLIAAFGIAPGDPLYADRIVEREIELRVALG
jgi:translocation and assembly module TamA